MLTGAEKDDGDTGGEDHADQGPDHVTDGITFADDEAVQMAPRTKGGVEMTGLLDGVRPDEGLADHEDLVRSSEVGELLQGRHESAVVVTSTGRVDEDDGEVVGLGMLDGFLGHLGRVLAVALFVQFHVTPFALAELLQVAGVHAQLLDRARSEGVAGGDEHPISVLQQEIADLRQIGRLANTVDPHNR